MVVLSAGSKLGDWSVLTDAKSGYHHIPMHDWTYLTVQWLGTVFAYPVCPFGSARACRYYMWIMAEVYRPLRLKGALLTYVIGDVVSSRTKARCVFVVKTLVMLLTALGFFLSWEKCQFVPVQKDKFLGLDADSQNSKIFVPEDKKLYIKEVNAELLADGAYTNRV